MRTVPRLILLPGGRRSNGDKASDAKPVAERDVIYRADYTQLWRLPPPLPPRRLPVALFVVLALVVVTL